MEQNWPNESSLQEKQQEKLEQDEDCFSVRDYSSDTTPTTSDLSDLSLHPYVALPPAQKPAEIVLEYLKGVPIGTPLEEIKRASDIFGLDFSFMTTIAKIESDFDPKQRTGSYIGLFQLRKLRTLDLEILLILATMPSRRPTNSRLKLCFLNWILTRNRRSAIFI